MNQQTPAPAFSNSPAACRTIPTIRACPTLRPTRPVCGRARDLSRGGFLKLALAGALLPCLLPGLLRGAETTYYTCGMHPQIIRTEPGTCPICGMDLVPLDISRLPAPLAAAIRRAAAQAGATTAAAGALSAPGPGSSDGASAQSPAPAPAPGAPARAEAPSAWTPPDEAPVSVDGPTIQRMNLRIEKALRGPVRRSIRALGVVGFDEGRLREVTVRADGWIEALQVVSTGSVVRAGDTLFEWTSPDLNNAALSAAAALKADRSLDGPDARAAFARLQLLGAPDSLIKTLKSGGVPPVTAAVTAPVSGVVVENNLLAGQMVRAGDPLMRIADVSTAWIDAQIYEGDLPLVFPGQPVAVSASHGGEATVLASVDRILPQVQPDTRAAIARITVPNPDGFWRPGMYADVRIEVQVATSAVLLPDSAVLRSGERDTVFVAKAGGLFEPRLVRLGAHTDDGRYQVLSGVSEGEPVVISGQFLLDSESRLQEAILKMVGGADAATTR